jgi:hypothetical protein
LRLTAAPDTARLSISRLPYKAAALHRNALQIKDNISFSDSPAVDQLVWLGVPLIIGANHAEQSVRLVPLGLILSATSGYP